MRWLPWRRDIETNTGGAEARRRAEEALDRTVEETPMYRALGESLRQIRDENHLTQIFRTVIHQERN